MSTIPQKIVSIGKWMFERRLGDIAGGNISARDEDQIYITPTRSGQDYLWELEPAQILHAPIQTGELMEHPQHSKESISHLMAYRAFPEVGAVIHAHPFHIMPFCAICKPLKPLTLGAQVYGEIRFIPDAPMYSAEQGKLIVQALSPKQELMARMAYAVLMPRHGIFVAGKNLNTVLDCLERIDNSAYCNLAVHLIE